MNGAEIGILDGAGADRHIRGGGAVEKRHGDTADHGAGPAAVVVRDGKEVAARAAEGHERAADACERVAAHREDRPIQDGERAAVAEADEIARDVEDARSGY